ncbi:hypothetical protein [Roseimaritima ulvae]|uniref:SLA1 homology domain-containing protein n=1 Tax=Roseimaritima ulvae TaxID=980254 RepID=A0A5B9QXI0_9BACT|nr:hypothetical protein [Roseimaritima ulvae]QEG43774.1 hypothetical protein UC8_58290 [Roseimaritima ulvae]
MPCPSLLFALRSALRHPAGFPPIRGLLLLTAALSIPLSLSMPGLASGDQWTDVSGQHTINADFLGVWGDKAVFAMPNGQRRTVLLKHLQAESRLRALDLAEQRKAHREEVKNELLEIQAAQRAPSAARIEGPAESAPPYQPLPVGASLQDTLDHNLQQTRAGHLRVTWDTLPKSYQQDIESLVVEFAKKMPPKIWNDQIAMINRLTELLASREDWVFSHPQVLAMVSGMTNDEQQARTNYRSVIGLIQTLTDPQYVSLERLQQGNLDGLIAELDEKAAGYLQPFLPLIEPTLPTSMIAEKVDDTHAVVTIVMPNSPTPAAGGPSQPGGQPYPGAQTYPGSESYAGEEAYSSAEMPVMEEGMDGMPAMPGGMPGGAAPGMGMGGGPRGGLVIKMVQVEGRWVSETMAKSWESDVERFRKRIGEMPGSLDSFVFMLDAMRQWVNLNLSPLEAAETREAFHSGMDQIVADFALVAMQALGRPPRANNANDPYNADYEREMGSGNEMDYQNQSGYEDGSNYEAMMQGEAMEAGQPPLQAVPQP